VPIISASVIKVEGLARVMEKIKALGLETTESEMDGNEYAAFRE